MEDGLITRLYALLHIAEMSIKWPSLRAIHDKAMGALLAHAAELSPPPTPAPKEIPITSEPDSPMVWNPDMTGSKPPLETVTTPPSSGVVRRTVDGLSGPAEREDQS